MHAAGPVPVLPTACVDDARLQATSQPPAPDEHAAAATC